MVGTVCAEEYWYIDDFEVTEAQLNTNIDVVVKAHFDYAVSAGQIDFTLPEGMVLRKITRGTDFNISYHDDWGDEWPAEQTVFVGAVGTANVGWAFADMDYYYDEATGSWLEAGSVKFMPGDYENQIVLTIRVTADFKGGELTVESQPSSTYDNRPDVEICPKDQDNFKTCIVTVEGAEPIQTPAPVIEVTEGDNAYIFTATGEGTVTLYADGVEVENPYTVERTDVAQVVKLTATAHVDGQTDGSVYGEYLVPALEVVEPVDPDGEIIISDPDENGVVTITYTGDEDDVTITVTVNGEEVELGEGGTVTVGEGESLIVVTVGGEGYNDLTAEKTVNYTLPEPPEPEPTATPEITYVVNDDNVVITATGEGEVILYVDGVEVENPYTIERGATDVVVVVTATAQAEGQLISDVATMEITIPAIGGVEPEDPHDVGVWVVFIDYNGVEHWYEMTPGYGEPTPYGCDLPLNKGTYGYPVNGEYPLVDFFLVVDGVHYGPEAYEPLTEDEQFGNANNHQLYEGDEHFAVESSFWYSIGIITDRETGIKYMQISKGVYTDVNELNAGKTVAGVRYFNMAGQEMQEANGVTIVVTTYTDGTTSAAKVMK